MRKILPDVPEPQLHALALIYDEVVHRIISEMMALEPPEALHIDLREEMALEIGKLMFWLSDRVAEERLEGRQDEIIDLDAERGAVLGPDGAAIISGTAKLAYDHIWSRRIEERWKPKTAKKLERQTNPRRAKLPVKKVDKNHFIPRWFIRDLWSTEGKVLRWRRDGEDWVPARRPFGAWGYGRNLYSDRLEAYFSLLEGDAKLPIEMLLDTRPLNRPQRESFVGFLVIQMLRNPSYLERHRRIIGPIVEKLEPPDDGWTVERAYDAMFGDNNFYSMLATPVMQSRWAIAKADAPLFVLPDNFSIRGSVAGEARTIVPLTPKACFVTLPGTEESKRIVPRHLPLDADLGRRIGSALAHAATREFLSAPNYQLHVAEPEPFATLLSDIDEAVAARGLEDD